MRSKALSLLLMGVVVSLLFVGLSVYAQRSKKTNKVWEYKVVRLCSTQTDLKALGNEGWELKSTDLNALGNEGWELTSVEASGRSVCPSFYFKRVR